MSDPAESEWLAARARTMMMISGLTTVLAIAAVVTVIGYRMYSAAGDTPVEDAITLPKGARIVSMAGSGGRVAVLIDNNGTSEMRVFDLKTMKESGHLRFTNERSGARSAAAARSPHTRLHAARIAVISGAGSLRLAV